MNLLYLISLVSSLFIACAPQHTTSIFQGARIIDVSDYGIEPNTNHNITAKINKLIKGLRDEPVKIVFPKGRYDFYPDSNYLKVYYETNTYDENPKRLAVFLEHKRNITIDAQGSDFVFHGHIQPFTLDYSENITIQNVNIDWDKPLTAEAKVLETDSSHILVRIDTFQFPHVVYGDKIIFAAEGWKADWKLSSGSWLVELDKNHIIPPQTGSLGCVNGDLKNVVYTQLSPGKVLMEGKFTKIPSVGNYLIMRHSTRDHAGIFLFHSKNIRLESINVYHTSGLGVLSQYCDNIALKKVNIIPNPKKGRYLSSHDDGLHFMGCRGKIKIDSCRAMGLMDDAVNIHGTCVPVLSKLDNRTLQCKFAHHMSNGLLWAEKGDTIGFINKKNMITTTYGVVEDFVQEGVLKFKLRFDDLLPQVNIKEYSLENLSKTPEVEITNSFAGSNRARGYLITTPKKVLIENNVFETSGSAILIAGDANYWYESGAVKDVTIRNNEFRYPCNSSPYQFCNAIISIYPEIPEIDLNHPYHRNIKIENNRFNPFDYPILYAKSVEGLIFANNKITRSYDYKPWRTNKISFSLDACRHVALTGNAFAVDVLGKNIEIKAMSRTELKKIDKNLTIEKSKDEILTN